MRPHLFSFAAALALTAAAVISTARAETDPQAVIDTYADIALAMYEDALVGAIFLQGAAGRLIDEPSEHNLEVARDAWIAARVPYQQTEGYRFGNAIVDDWEGRVNAWSLDEGLIDYVDTDLYGEESPENPLYSANVIANKELRIGPDVVDASEITPALLRTLHEALGVEANVAAGYHAVEFLLWGQDLNGTEAGAGERPASDYDTANCTNGNCDRRAAYLQAAADLLVIDLQEMVGNWIEGATAARLELAAKGTDGGLSTILTGLGSLSYGELAGERMKLGLILHDPEEEHDCFSDNTHNSHYYSEVGMLAIWNGRYTRPDGSVVEGPSIRDYAMERAPEAAARVDAAFEETMAKMQVMKETADSGEMAYDQMIAAGNDKGNAIVNDAVEALIAQARAIEGVASALGLAIEMEGSDSLDNPAAVQ